MIAGTRCVDEGGGRGGGDFFCANVRVKLVWRAIYGAKRRTNPKSRAALSYIGNLEGALR